MFQGNLYIVGIASLAMKDLNATVVIDLKRTKEDIYQSIHKSAKRGISKAQKSGLVVTESKEESDWNEFYKLYRETMIRGEGKVETIEHIRELGKKLFLCKKSGKLISAAAIDIIGKTAYLNRSGSRKDSLHMNPNNLLYWEIILWCKKNGIEELDLCGWQIKARSHLKGINEFKEKWGEIKYYKKSYPLYKALGRKLIRNSKMMWELNSMIKNKKNKSKVNKDVYDNEESVKHYQNEDYLSKEEEYLIKKHFKGRVLDLGCGSGRTTVHLSKKGFDVIGIDLSEKLIESAKEKNPEINYEIGDATKLKYKNEEFDIVFFSFNGIDCIFPEKERINAIKQFERVLKRDGILVFSSHNVNSLYLRFRPKFWARNIIRGTLFSRYKHEKREYGEFYCYYSSPKHVVDFVKKNSNLEFVEKVGGIRSVGPYYVFKKTGLNEKTK